MIIIQFIILLIHLFLFLDSDIEVVNFNSIILSSILTLFSFLISLKIRKRSNLANFNFSIVFFFFIMSWIIYFQAPLEIALGNNSLSDHNAHLIYDIKYINEMVSYSALVLDVFLLGVSLSYLRKNNNNKILLYKETKLYRTTPLLILTLFFFFMFISTVDKNYIDGGHGIYKFEGISFSFFGIFTRLSILYISLTIYNIKEKPGCKNNIVKFISSFNKLYLITLLLVILIFFRAHNRVFVIMTITPLLFAFFIHTKWRIKNITVFGLFIGLSVFGTLFKIYGIDNILDQGLTISDGYVIGRSYFPFTAELAASIYSHNILYTLYKNDITIYGLSFLVGFLRAFPGVMGILGWEPIIYDTATLASSVSNVRYGVGTTAVADLLINFGSLLTTVIMFLLGYLFARVESKVYHENNVFSYIIYFSISSMILFAPRASFNDIFGITLFNLIFIHIYLLFFKPIKIE